MKKISKVFITNVPLRFSIDVFSSSKTNSNDKNLTTKSNEYKFFKKESKCVITDDTKHLLIFDDKHKNSITKANIKVVFEDDIDKMVYTVRDIYLEPI